jgi:hypothetical protein
LDLLDLLEWENVILHNQKMGDSTLPIMNLSCLPSFLNLPNGNGVFHDFPHKNRRFHQHKNGSFTKEGSEAYSLSVQKPPLGGQGQTKHWDAQGY